MRRLCIAGVATVAALLAGSANAADLGVRPTYKAPPVVAPVPFTWTGFYIGAHIGGGWGDKILTTCDNATDSNCSGTVPPGFVSANGTVAGILGGGQIGFNFQFLPNWVAGIEADVSAADIKGGYSCFATQDALVNLDFADTCSSRADVLGTIVGRVGLTVGPAWVYVLGGGAWVHDQHVDDFFAGQSQCPCHFTATETRWGWTVGAGIEYAIYGNWSAKLQYNFMDFGDRKLTLVDQFGDEESENYRQRVHTVKFGINYRFGFGKGKGPVVASY
jgi:outer membrane immunogenic protein